MKRTFAIVLALVMLLTTAALPVHAAEATTSEKEEIIALACQAFPEYEAIIRGEVSTYQTARSATDEVELVFSETRSISENQYVSLSYYSNGRALLATVKETIHNHDVERDGRKMYGTISASFALSDSQCPGVFQLKNATYIIDLDGDDKFTSFGTRSYVEGEYCVYMHKYYSDKPYDATYYIGFSTSTNPTVENTTYARVGFSIENDTLEVIAITN